MAKEQAKEKGISPAIVIIPLGLGMGLAAVLALAGMAKAAVIPTPSPGKATLYGKVNDAQTGQPMVGVLITLDGMEYSTLLDGSYTFSDLSTGNYFITAQAQDYNTFSQSVTLTEGSHQLNVQLVPAAAPPAPQYPFTISGSGVGYVCPTMTGWWYPDLTFTITNPNSVAVTHTLQLWRRSISLAGGATEDPNAISIPVGNVCIPPGETSPIEITLQPGSFYSYRYTGWVGDPAAPGYWTTMARPRSFFYWLQDELGNKSPEVNIVRS